MRAVRTIMTTLTLASCLGMAAASAQTSAPSTPPAAAAPPATTPAEPDPAAVQTLIAAIDAAVAALGPNATAQDIEAAVTYTIDRLQQPVNVAQAALQFIATRPQSAGKIRLAMNAVSVRLRRGLAGTGAIEGASGAMLAVGPNVGGGGTGANYTPQN